MKKIELDKLQMYFCIPYEIDIEGVEGKITINQPKVRDLVEFGERDFFANLNVFIATTTTYRLTLWKMGIDWNEISNFDLFCLLYATVQDKFAELIFGKDFLFSTFQPYEKNDELVLYSKALNIEINEDVYEHISQYLRAVFKITPEEKKTKDPIMKKWFIEKDERELANLKKKEAKGKLDSFSILALISSCVNHAGFKYNSRQILDIGLYEFYDSVQRLQLYESATAVLKGMFSGFVDTSKINPDEYNFMKEI